MAASYDPTLTRDLDWVRFLTGDRDVSDNGANAQLEDQEIEALLREEANRYLAAARAGDLIITQGGSGVVSKQVGDLSVEYGGTPEEAYATHIKRVRERGCKLLLGTSPGGTVFRAT